MQLFIIYFLIISKGECGCIYDHCFDVEGTLESPNYPNDYPDDLYMSILITAPDGQTVTILFVDFELEYVSRSCSYDSLIIYDGSSTGDSEIGTYCGTISPDCITSTSKYLLMVFETDGSTEERGFRSHFNFQGK